ncbi:MAG: two-component system, chemotaxis family, sensor kinase CheA [Solirubrobacteraceae bacterium]|nr:two-component system, chemotaxis family, sensor kinase CheA [Solirubrobacteraceae bacterium]
MNEVSPEIFAFACEEVHDSLERMEVTALALERGESPEGAIDALFRDAHSIKGTTGMVGMQAVAAVASRIEDQLHDARSSAADPSRVAASVLAGIDELRTETIAAAGTPEAVQVAAPAAVHTRAIRVSADKVDRMLDVVGETVMHHRRLEHLAGEELDVGDRLLSDLRDAVIEMRTLPLDSITAAFPRAVRDLAAAAGKEVELVITGGDTQLDRMILEGISDVIVHVLRNAIAHGIERPEERVLQGKPSVGRLDLRAEQRGGMVALELSDDGRGVSPELLARAHDEGSLVDLLCAPGFSTAGEVSDLAGRGVGLDAVKTHVERLGGSIEVSSVTGAGTTVVLLLPLTLAFLHVLMFRRGDQAFALPLSSVREVVAVTETASLGGQRSLVLHGTSIPLADLATVIGATCPPLPEAPPALIVRSSSRVVAVACDDVIGDQEIVMKSLGPLLAGVAGYLGATVMQDGRVALVIDPNQVFKAHAAGARAPVSSPTVRVIPKILVVDDQFTVREMQRSILETAGYRVETARDGQEALTRIGADPDIELVLTDVQMPILDGFGLLRAIRALPERSSLPVAIITSMDGEDHRRRGVEEGADAYIVKQQFDQQTLLDTVARLVQA